MPYGKMRRRIPHTYSLVWPALLIAATISFLLWWTAH
jgi:hypothetical protein